MKKLITYTIFSLLFFSITSCYTHKTLNTPDEFESGMKYKNGTYQVNKRVKVLSVITKEGEEILFTKKYPCRVSDKYVFGFPIVKFPYSISLDSVSFENESIHYFWKDGVEYEILKLDKMGYVCCTVDTLYIPFSNIENIKVKKFSVAGTILLPVSSGVVLFLITSFIIYYIECGDGSCLI